MASKYWFLERKVYNPLMAKVDNRSYAWDFDSLPADVMEVERAAKTIDGIAVIVTIRRKKLNTARSKHWYWSVDDVRLA